MLLSFDKAKKNDLVVSDGRSTEKDGVGGLEKKTTHVYVEESTRNMPGGTFRRIFQISLLPATGSRCVVTTICLAVQQKAIHFTRTAILLYLP